MSVVDIREWVRGHDGIAHRAALLHAGASVRDLRAAVLSGQVRRVRRYWIAADNAPAPLLAAARNTATLACVSVARHRGWWIPPDADTRIHLHVKPHAECPRTEDTVVHWSEPIGACDRYGLVESIEDALDHIAACLPREQALVLWEAAARAETLSIQALQRVRWHSAAAREIAEIATGTMGSGLETIFVERFRSWGLPLRVQVPIAGHDVDGLIGDLLVIQVDGFAFHSSSADRTRDLAHDRELVSRGYTVLRFSYADVLYHWDRVERAVAGAIAQGRHLAS